MYNTTERLLVALAVDIYGLGNDAKIRQYIKNRSFNTKIDEWKNVYNDLIQDARSNGYENVLEFCEDMRFSKLLKIYKEKVQLRDDILSGKVSYDAYLKSKKSPKPGILNVDNVSSKDFDEMNKCFDFDVVNCDSDLDIEKKVDSSKKLKEIFDERSVPVYNAAVNIPVSEVKTITKQKVVPIKVEEELNPKHERKFYKKMNHEDKDFSDFIDKVEEYNYYSNSFNEEVTENIMSKRYPAFGKVKNLDHLKELREKEAKKNMEIKINQTIERSTIKKTTGEIIKISNDIEAIPKKRKKVSPIEEHYAIISDRVISRKRDEKDKTAWANELKTVMKVIELRIEANNIEQTKKVKETFKKIHEEITKEGTMSNFIYNGLMVIQELLFSCEDGIKKESYIEFKKVLCSFFDFYRK